VTPDFVAIGHVTVDRFGAAVRPGGAALYAAVAAHRLGLSAAILTSHGEDFPLEAIPPQIEVVSVDAPATTVFEYGNVRDAGSQRLESIARPLTKAHVPEDWREAPLVLLAPVIDEVDAHLVTVFPEASLGAAAQGWLRSLTPDGDVVGREWTPPAFLLGRLQTLVVSADDVRGQEAAALEWAQRVPVMAVTAGRAGALLYVNGDRYEVRPHRARQVDATGAGDVFAAALLIAYDRSGDAWEAAEAAACAAALSIEGEGHAAVPDVAALEAALADYRAR